MRLHRNLVEAVVQGLELIFSNDIYADKAIERLLKSNKRWGSRDRGFIAETCYEIVRYKRLYTEIAGVGQRINSKQDGFRIFAVWAVLRGISLPDWPEFKGTPERRIKGRFDTLQKERVFRESIPDWLDQMGLEGLGEALWESELSALNQVAPVVIRTNTLKTNPKQLQAALAEEGFETDTLKGQPEALVLRKRGNLFKTKSFSEGWFEVQDASSQRVAPLLDVAAGMRVLDCCAGAGGKTLHLAALMENKGRILATDIYPGKLNELKKRARRAGAFCIEPRAVKGPSDLKRQKGKFDRILIDAPCSGLGVIRRNPDTKWKLRPEQIETLIQTQREILTGYSRLLSPGGKLVYATCSILPQENRQQVDWFLASEAGVSFTLVQDEKIFASTSGFDGFYLALLERK